MQQVDYWGQAIEQSRFLKGLAFVLALAIAGLSVAVALPVYRGTPIHYVTCGAAGVSHPGVISDGFAADYVGGVLRSRYSFTPESIEASHREFIVALHPTVQEAFRKGAKEEARVVRSKKLGSRLMVLQAAVSGHSGEEVLVAVQAIRSIYMGGFHLRDEDVRGVVGIIPWVGKGHERGVVVSRMQLKPEFGEVGE